MCPGGRRGDGGSPTPLIYICDRTPEGNGFMDAPATIMLMIYGNGETPSATAETSPFLSDVREGGKLFFTQDSSPLLPLSPATDQHSGNPTLGQCAPPNPIAATKRLMFIRTASPPSSGCHSSTPSVLTFSDWFTLSASTMLRVVVHEHVLADRQKWAIDSSRRPQHHLQVARM